MQLSCMVRDEDNVDQKAEISIHHSDKTISKTGDIDTVSERDESVRDSIEYEVNLDDKSIVELREHFTSAQPIGCDLRHFLPERITCKVDIIKEDANEIAHALMDVSQRTVRSQRIMRRDIFLSKEIIAVLRCVLGNTIDFDGAFDDEPQQGILPGMGLEGMKIRTWHKNFLKLSPRDQVEVQQVLRERDDLPGLFYEAMRASQCFVT